MDLEVSNMEFNHLLECILTNDTLQMKDRINLAKLVSKITDELMVSKSVTISYQ